MTTTTHTNATVTRPEEWYSGQHTTHLNDRGNLPTRMWGRLRGISERIRKEAGIKDFILNWQRRTLGDVAGKRVLDLGCGSGNRISIELARNATEYLAFDLSAPAIAELRRKLDAVGLQRAGTTAGDFLSPAFPYEPFDVVYANSVIHHFHPLDRILGPLRERTAPGARIVLMDPLQTCVSMHVVRGLTRPLRSDAAWNWPFTREDLKTISKYFEISAVQGFLGHSKWAVAAAVVPGCEQRAIRWARRLHALDAAEADSPGRGLWRCNSVLMQLVRH